MAILAKMAELAINRQTVNKNTNEMAKGPFGKVAILVEMAYLAKMVELALRYRSHLRKVFIFAGQKTTKIGNRNRKRKLLLKPRRVALVGGNCFCFDTLRTEVDQIPEITDANVYPHVFNRRDSVRFSKEK